MLLAGFQRSCDLEVYPVSNKRWWDKRGEPADVPAEAQHVPQVVNKTQVIGSARRVPFPGGLPSKQQEQVEEKEGGDEQETYNAGVSDKGKGEGPGWNLAWKTKEDISLYNFK